MNDWFDAEQHVDRAHELYELGRWDEAETELRQALARNPYQAEWHFNLGLTLEAAGKHRDAVEAFSRSFELSPEDGQAALLAGVNALRAEEPEAAIDWLEKAQQNGAEPGATHAHRIEAFCQLGRHESAEETFYIAQEMDPANAEIYSAMAESLLDRRLYEKAVWCLREAARLDPEMPRVQARLAEAYAATGRHERARQLYLRELRTDPGDVDTLLDLGSLLADMGRLTEAGEKFRRVLEIEPDNVEAHFSLGDLAEREGDDRGALEQYEVVLRLDSSYSEARRRLAGLVLGRVRAGELEVAHRLLRMELQDVRERPHAFGEEDLVQLGHLLLDAGLAREAIGIFESVVARSPRSASAHHMLGVAFAEAGRLTDSIEWTRRAVELDPRLTASMHNLALVYLRLGQWRRMRYWLRQGLGVRRDDSALRRLRTRVRIRGAFRALRWLAPVRRHRAD